MIEGSEVPAQDAEGEHDCERPEPNCYPEPRAEAVGGMHVLQDWLVWHLRALGHAFLLKSRSAVRLLVRGPCLPLQYLAEGTVDPPAGGVGAGGGQLLNMSHEVG